MRLHRNTTVPAFAETYADPHWSGVVSLLHFNGTNGGTTFTDVKGVSWSRRGTASTLTTTNPKFGTACMDVASVGVPAGLTTSVTADWNFGTGDFTIEMWAYNTSWTNSSGNQQFLFSRYNGNGGPYLMQILSTGTFQCLVSNTNASWAVNCSTPSGTFPLNQWVHLAFCRLGPNFMAYINGVRLALTTNNIGSLYVDAQPIDLGGSWIANTLGWGGQIDDFRATKGICRYPENFTPPTRQHPDFGQTPSNDFVSYVTSLSPDGHSALGIYDGSNYFYNDVTTTYSPTFQRKTVNADSDALTNAGGATSAGPIPGRGKFVAMSDYPAITNDGLSHPIFVNGVGVPQAMSFALAVRPTVAANAQICSMNVYFASSFAAFPMALWFYNTGAVSLGLSIGNDYSIDASDVGLTTPPGSVPLNKWSYIVVRYDTVVSTVGPVYLYVNGVKYTGNRTTAFPAYSGGFAIGSPYNHYQGGKSTPQYFYGEVAEFTHWITTPTTVTDTVASNLYTRFRNAAGPAQVEYTDPYLSNVVGLFHFDGTNGATTFVDDGPNAFELVRVGTSTISTAQSKFGGSSYLSATSSCVKCRTIESDFLFGSGDFTVEAWVYLTGGANERVICGVWDGGGLSWIMTINNVANLTFYYSTDGSNGLFSNYTTGYTVPTNAWTHVAVSRNGSTLRIFINGVARFTNASFSGTFANVTNKPFSIGGQPDVGTGAFAGYIEDVRITKGVGRYTADFTPQAVPYINPGWRGIQYSRYMTSLLHFEGTNGSTTITDVKGNSWSCVTGATISTAQSKFGSSSLALTTSNGSRIEVSPATLPAIGSGDYTIEFFVRLNTNNTYRGLFDTRDFGVASSATRITLYWANDTSQMHFYQGGANRISGGNLTTGTWHHVCVERYNGNVRLFLNGTQVGSTYANTATIDNTGMMLGVVSDAPTAWNGFDGNFDEFRILVGVARYRGNPFTPPVVPYPDA